MRGSRQVKASKAAEVLGCKLRAWRQRKGYPLKRVAADLGVSVSIVSEWETGHRFPCGNHFDAISEYLSIPHCALLCPDGEVCLTARKRA